MIQRRGLCGREVINLLIFCASSKCVDWNCAKRQKVQIGRSSWSLAKGAKVPHSIRVSAAENGQNRRCTTLFWVKKVQPRATSTPLKIGFGVTIHCTSFTRRSRSMPSQWVWLTIKHDESTCLWNWNSGIATKKIEPLPGETLLRKAKTLVTLRQAQFS